MTVALYETALTVVAIATATAIARRKGWTMQAAAQAILPIILGSIVLLAFLGAIVALAMGLIKNNSTVTICETNEANIAAAFSAWQEAYGTFPAQAATPIVAANGTTAGTFSAPGTTVATADLLKSTPSDPVNPAGKYTLAVTAASAGGEETWVITCPGPHLIATLSKLPGGSTATKGQIVDSNGAYSAI